MDKTKTKNCQNSINLTFQQSIDRISEIVTIMEDGKCELENMVDLYKEGTGLVKTCSKKLEKAKITISQINAENPPENSKHNVEDATNGESES
ncbi:MAG: exodeoxyribonuclease VII small subunit [Alphaproteobacteria bacterium]|nr:exodeoxyribonuclease VII small subunit [Rickettsiales bacterium]